MVKGTMRAAAVLAVALLPVACGDGPTSPSGLVDTEWRLASVELPGAAPVTVTRPDRFTLRLGADGAASALVVCNSCGGRYELAGDRLTVSRLACTLAFCVTSEDAPALASFPSLLEGASVAATDAAGLTIRSERGTLRFVR